MIHLSVNKRGRITSDLWVQLLSVTVIVGAMWAAAAWIGFLDVLPWEPGAFRSRGGRRFNDPWDFLFAMTVLFYGTVAFDYYRRGMRNLTRVPADSREEFELQGRRMRYTRGSTIGTRIEREYDLTDASGFSLESGRIVFSYGGQLHALAYLATPDERAAVLQHILDHKHAA